jgi:hypothetical protein
VLVSDNMELQCCVLGTEPTLFRAPKPTLSIPETSETMRQDLARITAGINALTASMYQKNIIIIFSDAIILLLMDNNVLAVNCFTLLTLFKTNVKK